MLKIRKGLGLLDLGIAVVILAISFVVIPSPSITIRTVSDDMIKDQSTLLDNALSEWYSHHAGYYPNTLVVLQDLHFIANAVDLNRFNYSLQSDNTQYQLTTVLKDGSTYKSIGSKF